MQMNAYLNKEQIGTLFVRVGAPEGGFWGGREVQQPKNRMCLPSNKFFLPPAGIKKNLPTFRKEYEATLVLSTVKLRHKIRTEVSFPSPCWMHYCYRQSLFTFY
jgi:hypothetical protein